MIDVVGALITNDHDEILIARRKEGKHLAGCWEFPGGKVEKGEEPEDTLKRELKEEMNLDIEVLDYLDRNEHQYEDFTINLMIYPMTKNSKTPSSTTGWAVEIYKL